MYKKLLHVNTLLLLPLIAASSLLSMEKYGLVKFAEKKEKHLEESVITIATPTHRGLGLLNFVQDALPAWEAPNTLLALENKTVDLKNSSWLNKIDRTAQFYSASSETITEFAKMVYFCREEPYKGHIQINVVPFRMGHKHLVQESKKKQNILKETIETNDREIIEKYNLLLDDLQDTVEAKIRVMENLLTAHSKTTDSLVTEKSNDIRTLKKALVNLHHLNKERNVLLDDNNDPDAGYCSDEETNANNVDNSYNNKHLLEKNNIALPMTQTITNMQKTTAKLYQITSQLVEILPIKYKTTII